MMIMYYIAEIFATVVNYILDKFPKSKDPLDFEIPKEYLIIGAVIIAFIIVGVIFHLLSKKFDKGL